MVPLNNSFLEDQRMEVRQMGVELFAASLLEVIPKIFLVTTKATPLGFYCECISPIPLTEEYQGIILERVRRKLKERPSYRIMEMVSTNAKDYMHHIRQPYRKKYIDTTEQFTPVIQIEEYANPLEGPVSDAIGAISIEKVTITGEVIKIFGFAEKSREILKSHRKRVKGFLKHDHLKVGMENGLFIANDGITWLKKGLNERQKLFIEIGKKLDELGIQEVFFEGENPLVEGDWYKLIVGASLGEMGLKDAPMQSIFEGRGNVSHLDIGKWRGEFCYLEDGYGIEWVVAEVGKNFKIYLDTLFALRLEEKGKKDY